MSARSILGEGSEHLRPIKNWSEALTLIEAVNKPLADDLKSAKRHFEASNETFWLARYPYGDLLVEDGKFMLPSAVITRANSAEIPHYSSTPLVLVLEKSVEVFFNVPYDHEKRQLVPLRLIRAGEMFGVFEAADRLVGIPPVNADYSISSG